jgi:hypothetical protein
MTIERPQIDAAELPARRAGERQPRKPGCDRSADRRVKPQRAPASLPRIPDGNDLLCINDGFALSLGALGLGGGPRGGPLSFLRSAVRFHAKGYRSKRR